MKMRLLKRERADYALSDHWWYAILWEYPWVRPGYVHDFGPVVRDVDYSSIELVQIADYLTARVVRFTPLFGAPYGTS